nr:hypothetical protein [Tanacetum cinerariifolium]
RRHRLPGLQAAGGGGRAGRAGTDARTRAAIPGRSEPGARDRRRRLRQGAQAGPGNHAR